MAVMDAGHNPARVRHESDRNQEALQLCVQRSGDSTSAQRFQFEQGFAVIGSSDGCQLRLDDSAVPARAWYIQQLTDRVVAVPLDAPTSDCPLGGNEIVERRVVNNLPAGVPLSVGPFQIWQSAVIASDQEGLPRVGDEPLPSFAEPIAVWDIANVKGEHSALRSRHLRHALTLIGRGPACRFRMMHSTIAEIHASLVYRHGELQVIDLCSEYGVWVNGQRVSHAVLQDGDELRIGQCHGVVHWLVQPQRAAAPMPQPVELSPVYLAENVPSDGIVVSLSDTGLDVRDAPVEPIEDAVPGFQPYSEEHCLTLVTQFLEMQQSVLEQTQLLMQKISERLQTVSPPVADETRSVEIGREAPAKRTVPKARTTRSDRLSSPAGEIRPSNPPPDELNSAPAPEFHAWLTHQLAELETSQRTGFSRIWERLTGFQ